MSEKPEDNKKIEESFDEGMAELKKSEQTFDNEIKMKKTLWVIDMLLREEDLTKESTLLELKEMLEDKWSELRMINRYVDTIAGTDETSGDGLANIAREESEKSEKMIDDYRVARNLVYSFVKRSKLQLGDRVVHVQSVLQDEINFIEHKIDQNEENKRIEN